MSIKATLLAAGFLAGQTDEELIKFVENNHPKWVQPVKLSKCNTSYEKRMKEGKEYEAYYVSAHIKYWDAKLGHKGADKEYHLKHDKGSYDQDHDGIADCQAFDEEKPVKDEIKARAKLEKEAARRSEFEKEWEEGPKRRAAEKAEKERIKEEKRKQFREDIEQIKRDIEANPVPTGDQTPRWMERVVRKIFRF